MVAAKLITAAVTAVILISWRAAGCNPQTPIPHVKWMRFLVTVNDTWGRYVLS